MVMTEVTVRIPVPREFNMGRSVKIEQYTPFREEGGKLLLRVKDFDEKKLNELLKDPDVMQIDVTGGFASVILNRCAVCKMVEGAFLLEARKDSESTMIWKFLVIDDSFRLEKLKAMNAEIISIKRLSEMAELTDTESEVVRFAHEMGYFDIPKKINVRDLARRLGKSPSTINEIIQRGEKKILGMWVVS